MKNKVSYTGKEFYTGSICNGFLIKDSFDTVNGVAVCRLSAPSVVKRGTGSRLVTVESLRDNNGNAYIPTRKRTLKVTKLTTGDRKMSAWDIADEYLTINKIRPIKIDEIAPEVNDDDLIVHSQKLGIAYLFKGCYKDHQELVKYRGHRVTNLLKIWVDADLDNGRNYLALSLCSTRFYSKIVYKNLMVA